MNSDHLGVVLLAACAILISAFVLANTFLPTRQVASRLPNNPEQELLTHYVKSCGEGKPWIKTDGKVLQAGKTLTLQNATKVPLLYDIICSLKNKDSLDMYEFVGFADKRVVVASGEQRQVPMEIQRPLPRQRSPHYSLLATVFVQNRNSSGPWYAINST